jgi:undecaprenyl diphosphate synthase
MSWIENQTDDDKKMQQNVKELGKVPKHLAIIMDGNGRWAQNKSMPRVAGHKFGIESVREIVRASSNIGIQYLTLYAFSIENWNRPQIEVKGLMSLLEIYLKKEIDELNINNVKITTVGKTSSLPHKVQTLLYKAIDKTKDNEGMNLVLALSYSGRWDIMRTVQMIALDVRRGKISPEDINEDYFTSQLQTAGMPDPDLMIRTSGENRISNFYLWELAYSEIYITEKLWPEFKKADLYEALSDFANRERRFGKTSAQLFNEVQTNEIQKTSYLQRVLDAIKK